MKNKPSMYPALHAYMHNLYHAGMSIETVMNHGYILAENLAMEHATGAVAIMETASIMLHAVSLELGLSIDQQEALATEHS